MSKEQYLVPATVLRQVPTQWYDYKLWKGLEDGLYIDAQTGELYNKAFPNISYVMKTDFKTIAGT